jgi:hypothetical protein
VIFLTPSPISLNESDVSSTVDFTRSRTRAVSCFVPNFPTSADRRATLRVRAKRSSESLLAKSRNSGSSAYWASSLRRKLVGCDSRLDECWNDIVCGKVNGGDALELCDGVSVKSRSLERTRVGVDVGGCRNGACHLGAGGFLPSNDEWPQLKPPHETDGTRQDKRHGCACVRARLGVRRTMTFVSLDCVCLTSPATATATTTATTTAAATTPFHLLFLVSGPHQRARALHVPYPGHAIAL